MFRATSCSSSGESILSIKHLVYVRQFGHLPRKAGMTFSLFEASKLNYPT